MRILKVLSGLGCFIAAFVAGSFALLGFSSLGTGTSIAAFMTWILTALTMALIWSGWRLTVERIVVLSLRAKALIGLTFCLFGGFVVTIAIPDFVAAGLARSSNACINNLRLIQSAKEQWALENNKNSNDIPTAEEISVYLPNDAMPACPKGGNYTIGLVDDDPTCSIGILDWPDSHSLNGTGSWWLNLKMAYGKLFGLRYAKLPQQDVKHVR